MLLNGSSNLSSLCSGKSMNKDSAHQPKNAFLTVTKKWLPDQDMHPKQYEKDIAVHGGDYICDT